MNKNKSLFNFDVTVTGEKFKTKTYTLMLAGNNPQELEDCFVNDFHFTIPKKEMIQIRALSNRKLTIVRKSKHGKTNY